VIELVYRPQADLFGDMPDVMEVKMTLGDNVDWESAVREFINFLNASGYEPPDICFEQKNPELIGLTDEEINEAVQFPYHAIPFARAIEAKLKEKNT